MQDGQGEHGDRLAEVDQPPDSGITEDVLRAADVARDGRDLLAGPRAGIVDFLPLCDACVEGMARANAKSKATYRSNFAHPAVRTLLEGRSVLDVARMDAEVKTLLNKILGSYSDDYRGNVRPIITGTLDECVRRGVIPRHTLSGIELAPRIVTAEQYEQQNKGMVAVSDDTVRMLAEGITVVGQDKNGRQRTRVMPGVGIAPWLQRTMGLRIREALGVRKADSGSAPTAPDTCSARQGLTESGARPHSRM